MSIPISGQPDAVPKKIPELPSEHKALLGRRVSWVKGKLPEEEKKPEKVELAHISHVVGQSGPIARVAATAVIIGAHRAKKQAAERSGEGVLGQHSVKKKEPGEV